jgi:hypothetical protein
MGLVGLAITFLGFLLAAMSVGFTSSLSGRFSLVLVGLALTLVGILGVINPAYARKAIWRR